MKNKDTGNTRAGFHSGSSLQGQVFTKSLQALLGEGAWKGGVSDMVPIEQTFSSTFLGWAYLAFKEGCGQVPYMAKHYKFPLGTPYNWN